MALFNSKIGYQGQDLHLVRNNQQFPLHEFFDKDSSLSYTFHLNEDPQASSTNYENIEIIEDIDDNNIKTVFIKAGPRSSNMTVDNFYVTVQGNGDISVILIQLHEAIDKVWASPHLLTYSKGMSIKHGLLVSFTDGTYADLSFYYGVGVSKNDNLHDPLKLDDNNRLVWAGDINLPVAPNIYENIVDITVPTYMENSGEDPTPTTSGSVKVVDVGILKLHSGNREEIDKRTNILFLSDGYDNQSQQGRNIKGFHKIITELQNAFATKNTYGPWNVLYKKTNIWSYYTHAEHSMATLEGDYIKFNTDNVSRPLIGSLFQFINFFDKNVVIFGTAAHRFGDGPTPISKFAELYLNGYPNQMIQFLDLTSSDLSAVFPLFRDDNNNIITSGNILTLANLCSKVGLPSEADQAKDLQTKMNEWRAVNWIDGVRYGNEGTNVGIYFLHKYVFNMWKKLFNRIILEKTDTSYGVINTNTHRRFKNNFVPAPYLGPGLTKFPLDSIETYGTFINRISGEDSSNLGGNYFESDGKPVLDITTKLGRMVKTCDNTVILSRVRSNYLYGTNADFPYAVPDPNDNSISIKYSVHRSTISLEDKVSIFFTCDRVNFTALKPDTYIQRDINTKRGSHHVRNTVTHEFSHNYLRDEYSLNPGDLSNHTGEINRVSSAVENSNVQIGDDLKTPSSFIDASKVKWRWPRVIKIGVGVIVNDHDSNGNITKVGITEVDTANNIYECVVETNEIDEKQERSFKKHEKIILRKRFLFDTPNNIICTITEDVSSEEDYKQKVTFQTDNALDLQDFVNNGFMLVLPVWRENTIDQYQELIHHDIKDAISNTTVDNIQGRPLVIEDNTPNNEPQKIDQVFIDQNKPLFRNWKNHSEIVGLFAGGVLSYTKGIYHATNFCLMRGAEDNVVNGFCPVCSYIIIDHLNPLKHPTMNSLYGEYKSSN